MHDNSEPDNQPPEQNPDLADILKKLQSGRDDEACQQLWVALYPQIVAAARSRIDGRLRRTTDEEDIGQSAMRSLFRAAEVGRLADIHSSDALWSLLFTIMVRKIARAKRSARAKKRGGGLVRGDSIFGWLNRNRDRTSPATGAARGFDSIADAATIDHFVAELMIECRERLEQLPDDQLRTVALQRMEGLEIAEIAESMQISRVAVHRKLKCIRLLWADKKASS